MTLLATHLPVIAELDLKLLRPAHAGPDNPGGQIRNQVLSSALSYYSDIQIADSAFVQAPLELKKSLTRQDTAGSLDLSHNGNEIVLYVLPGHECVILTKAPYDVSYSLVPWPLKFASAYQSGSRVIPITSFMDRPAFSFEVDDGERSWSGMLPVYGADHNQTIPHEARILRKEMHDLLIREIVLLVDAFRSAVPLGKSRDCVDAARRGEVAFPWFVDIKRTSSDEGRHDFLWKAAVYLAPLDARSDSCLISMADRVVHPDGSLSDPTILFMGTSDTGVDVVTEDKQAFLTKLLSAKNSPLPLREQIGMSKGGHQPRTTVLSVALDEISAHRKLSIIKAFEGCVE